MSATVQHHHDSPIERLSAWIAQWRRERAERAELEAMGCDEVNRMLSDCGVSPNSCRKCSRRWACRTTRAFSRQGAILSAVARCAASGGNVSQR